MSASAPTFIVAVVAPDRDGLEAATQLKEKLHRRGLRVHMARALQEPEICECDILLVPCRPRQMDALAEQIEQLWTQKWAAWYAVIRDAYSPHSNGAQHKKRRALHGR